MQYPKTIFLQKTAVAPTIPPWGAAEQWRIFGSFL
jgi:hypothetical protein